MYTIVIIAIIAIILIIFGLSYILLLAYGRISDKGAEIVTKFFGEARGSTGLILVILGVILLIIMSLLIEEPVGIPDFSISVKPMSGEVQQGGVIQTIVTVAGILGYEQPVNLSTTGQPSGVAINFVPPFGEAKPSYTSSVTINVDQNVPADDYTIIIKGMGADGKEHTCSYTLTVKPSNTTNIIDSMESTVGWGRYRDDKGSSMNIKSIPGRTDKGIEISYDLKELGWVQISKKINPEILSEYEGIKFYYKGSGEPNTIELKLIYENTTTFGVVWHGATVTDDWVALETPYSEIDCWWPEDNCIHYGNKLDLKKVRKIEFVISNKPDDGDANGSGWVIIDDVQGIAP